MMVLAGVSCVALIKFLGTDRAYLDLFFSKVGVSSWELKLLEAPC